MTDTVCDRPFSETMIASETERDRLSQMQSLWKIVETFSNQEVAFR